MRLFGKMSLPSPLLLLVVVVMVVICAGYSDGARLTSSEADWGRLQLEPELEDSLSADQILQLEPELEPASLVERVSADQACSSLDLCNITCTLSDLQVVDINSTDFTSCAKPELLTITVDTPSTNGVLRLRLNATSKLGVNELLTVLEDGGVKLAVLTKSQETWVASQQPKLTLEYQQSDDPDSQIQLTLVAYNLTQEDHIITDEMTGVLEALEQTNCTGSSDYAVNTEQYWLLNLQESATHVNFTVTNLDLDPAAGDVLIIGSGKGPYDTEPTAELLTGKFLMQQRYHVSGGQAFVYFISGAHATPRTPFKVSYEAEPIVGPTTTVQTTTDRDNPPTPSGVNFQLDCYVTGIDPRRFVDANDTAAADLQKTLADYTDYYRSNHDIPSRPVHQDDIQFSWWRMCNSASGWTKSDDNCVRVTWYVELLNDYGDWAFLEADLRGVIIENGDDINTDLGYQFSLTLDEVNKTWWWAITIALVPIALIAFLVVMKMSSSSNKVKSSFDENASIIDYDDLDKTHQSNIDQEVKTITENDHNPFSGDSEFKEYDPELQGPRRHHGRQAVPLKSALKAPKTTSTTYTNAAFEGNNGGSGGGVRTSFLPEEPSTPAAPAATLPAEPASSELTEQLRLLNELNKTLKEEQQQQAPGFELPRVDRLVKPTAVKEQKLYSMNEDGTGTEIDAARPGENVLQLDNDSTGDESKKTSSV